MTRGETLRALRIHLDLSIGEAARALGVSTVHYSAAEDNRGAELSALQLAEVQLRRASAGKHLPELARTYSEINIQLGKSDAIVLRRRYAKGGEGEYAQGVSDVLAWLLGCPGETSFSREAMR